MNLRIEGQKLRFRLSKKELELLTTGKTLEQKTHLPGSSSALQISIVMISIPTPLSFHYQKNHMTLSVDNETLMTLWASLPNRSGISTTQETGESTSPLELSLDIDIFTQKRKRAQNES